MLQTLKNLPDSPGVYQFFDVNGKLLYVGKAKILKNRVKSYFRFTPELGPSSRVGPRIHKMISEAKHLEYIVVNSESDALVLENSLIKQLRPKYNILLRDDKTYPYIYVDMSERYPRFEITRKVMNGKQIKYFGPFVSSSRELLNAIYENFMLVQKKACLKQKKACLFYQIHRCPAPCEFDVDETMYRHSVEEAAAAIADTKKLLPKLHEKMQRLAEQCRFEEAASTRDAIRAFEQMHAQSQVDLLSHESFDLFAAVMDEKEACIVRFFVRDGKLASSSHSFVKFDTQTEDIIDELYTQALLGFYMQGNPLTIQRVFIIHDIADKTLIEQLIFDKYGKKIQIATPKRTEQKNIGLIAVKNGMELLRQHQGRKDSSVLRELKTLLDLEATPQRIETFDNSHNFGDTPVASMVVWDDELRRDDYRHYSLEARSEYEQMRETLTRRALRFEENPPPDLWLLDGGKANLDLALSILASTGANVDVIAIAKEKIDGRAHRAKSQALDTLYTKTGILKLPASDKRLQFLQTLRDEAHRFAITFHRTQKIKNDKKISLMKLHGIKEGKIKRLLDYFGSFSAIESADVAELEHVLSEREAKSVFDYLRNMDAKTIS